MSSDSVVSSTSGYSNNYYSASADAESASFAFTPWQRHHHPDDYYSSDGAEQYPVVRTSAHQEDTCSKRIACKQKRREDLKDGYETLKIELPNSNIHSNKLSSVVSKSLLNPGFAAFYSDLETRPCSRYLYLSAKDGIGASES